MEISCSFFRVLWRDHPNPRFVEVMWVKLLGYRMNIQSDWNINAAEFKKILSLNPPKITCVS